jgi:hypothetical protein
MKVPGTLILQVGRTLFVRQSATLRPSNKYHNSALGTMASVDSILAGKYPAKAHAKRVVEYIKKSKPGAKGVLYLEGQKTQMIEDNDEAQPFR